VGEAPIRTVLIGATGRMGVNILRELSRFPRLALCGAVASESSHAAGEDATARLGLPAIGVAITAALPPLLRGAGLAIDFSSARAAPATLAACVAARVPLLIGTTGLAPETAAPLAAAAEHIPLLVAANTSLGLNVMLSLVRAAAAALPGSFDIEIVETHHREKVDAPSGTALAIGRVAAESRGQGFDQTALYARRGQVGARATGAIGFASVRGGDVVGEHEVRFLGQGEQLMLRHSVSDRAVFARGALQAAQWLAGRAPGRYQMSDVFIS
jgi:4-hydroxy-tetrahydrodipicolinate reductase